jgi:hypothetical protein
MKNILLRTWLGTILSVMGFFSPVAKAVLPEPALLHPSTLSTRAISVKPVIRHTLNQDITGMNLHGNEKAYTYVFAGKAVQNGQPSANTRVTVHLITSDTTLVREAITDAEGTYNLTLPVTGEPSETVHWEISALTPEMKQASLEGHQILMDDSTIQLNSLLSVF